jgi:hypothetical protein
MRTRPTPPPPTPAAIPAPGRTVAATKPDRELPARTVKPDLELPARTVKPSLASSSPTAEAAAGAPAPRLRIKNASAIRVTLGTRRHEPASAIRPEKGIWNVVLASELTGASAELVDLTPEAPRSRWSVEVQGDKIVLDAHRFLPTHVYQIDVRKDRSVIGTALLYLHQPPVEKRARVEFTDLEAKGKGSENAGKRGDASGIAPVPKGGL